MSVILQLQVPEELESELQSEAAQLGLPLEEYLLRVLSTGRLAKPSSGADLVAYWQREGVVGTRSDVTDSQQHARDLRKQAEMRERP